MRTATSLPCWRSSRQTSRPLWIEGFGEVIVGPQLQAHDAVVKLGFGGEHEDGDVVTLLAQFAADFKTALAGQHDVEHEEVELALECLGQSGGTIGGAFHLLDLRA